MTGSVSYNEPAQWNKVNFFFFKFFNQSQAKRRHYWNEAPRMNIHSNNSRQTSERLMSLDVICFLFLCVRRRMLRLSRFVCINRPLFLCVPSAGNKCHAEPINASAAIYWVMYSILFVVCFRIRAVRRGKLLNICQKSEKREYFVSSTVDFPGFPRDLIIFKKNRIYSCQILDPRIHFSKLHRATNQSTWGKQQQNDVPTRAPFQ